MVWMGVLVMVKQFGFTYIWYIHFGGNFSLFKVQIRNVLIVLIKTINTFVICTLISHNKHLNLLKRAKKNFDIKLLDTIRCC